MPHLAYSEKNYTRAWLWWRLMPVSTNFSEPMEFAVVIANGLIVLSAFFRMTLFVK